MVRMTVDNTTQRHIDVQIERLEKLTGLKLNDDILSALETDNHRLTSIRADTTETDITHRYDSKEEFYNVVYAMVQLMEEIERQKQ